MKVDTSRLRWSRSDYPTGGHHYVLSLRGNVCDHWLALIYPRGRDTVLRVFPPWEKFYDVHGAPQVPRVPPGWAEIHGYNGNEDRTFRQVMYLMDILSVEDPPSHLLVLPGFNERAPDPYDLKALLNEGTRIGFARLRDKLPEPMARAYSRLIRWQRYQSLLMDRKSWQERYPKHAEAISREFSRETQDMDDPSIDSFRVMREGDRAGRRAFKRSRSCCGSYEWEFKVGSTSYTLGFNYGH